MTNKNKLNRRKISPGFLFKKDRNIPKQIVKRVNNVDKLRNNN